MKRSPDIRLKNKIDQEEIGQEDVNDAEALSSALASVLSLRTK